MADYYPVLKRAISSLPPGSGEARRAVYERARVALLRQLNTYDPPLSPSDITDQRLALEESIRRVESEVGDVALHAAAEQPAVRSQLAPTLTPATPPAPAIGEPAATAPRREPPREPAPRSVQSRPATPPPAPTPTPALVEDRGQPRIGAGVSALSKTLRQAGTLGEASSTAVRVARQAIEETDDEPPVTDRPEPPLAASRAPRQAHPAEQPAPRHVEPTLAPPVEAEAVDDNFEREAPASLQWPTDEGKPSHRNRILIIAGLAVLVAGVALGAVMFRDDIASLIAGPAGTGRQAVASAPASDANSPDGLEPKIVDRLPAEGEQQPPVAPDAHEVKTETVATPAVDPDLPPQPASAANGQPGTAAPTAPVATADAGAAATVPAAGAEAAPSATAEQGQPGVLVAQRAILYEEPIPGSPGTKLEGRVVWSFVNEPPLPGEKPVPQIRGVIEIPDNKLGLKLSIHRNADQALPASHIVELNFDVPAAFPGRNIDMTPGLIAKQTEEARGDPIIGAVAKVSDNFYWLALSGLQPDIDRNVALLKSREWIDIPIRYGNRRRAILTFEKGVQGGKVFEDAFKSWNE